MEGYKFNNPDENNEPAVEQSLVEPEVSSLNSKRGIASKFRSIGVAAMGMLAASMPDSAHADQPKVPETGPAVAGQVDMNKMSQAEWQQYQDNIFKETQAFLKKAKEDAEKMSGVILANQQAPESINIINNLGDNKELIQKMMQSTDKTLLKDALVCALELYLLDTTPRSQHVAISGTKRQEWMKANPGVGIYSTDYEEQERKELKEFLEECAKGNQ